MIHRWRRVEPQGAGRSRSRHGLWQTPDPRPGNGRGDPPAAARGTSQLSGRDRPDPELRSLVHAAPFDDSDLRLSRLPEDDRSLRGDCRWDHSDEEHASHRGGHQRTTGRRGTAGGPGPGPDHCYHALAGGRRRNPPGSARRIAPGSCLLCGLLSSLRSQMAEHGFVEEAAAIAAAWSRGDRDAVERAVSDELIDATSIAGTPEQCCERVEAYRRSGIDVPILSPFARGARATAKFEALIRACAPSADDR